MAIFLHTLLTKYRYILRLELLTTRYKFEILWCSILRRVGFVGCSWRKVKGGDISRSPILKFGDGLHISFKAKAQISLTWDEKCFLLVSTNSTLILWFLCVNYVLVNKKLDGTKCSVSLSSFLTPLSSFSTISSSQYSKAAY